MPDRQFFNCDCCCRDIEGEPHQVDGALLCDECLTEHCERCDRCENLVSRDDLFPVSGERTRLYCTDCYDEHTSTCYRCERIFDTNDLETTHDGYQLCDYCYSNYTYICNCCEEVVHETTTVQGGGEVCNDCLRENYTKCYWCEEYVNNDDIVEHNGEHYCSDCFEQWYARCTECGEVFERRDTVYVDANDGRVCFNCLEQNYIQCEACHEWYHQDDIDGYRQGDRFICDCCTDYYGFCDMCGRVTHHDYLNEHGDQWICDDCTPRTIYNYSYKPHPLFYSMDGEETNIFFGIELEIDRGGCDSFKAQTLLEVVNKDSELGYFKRDGSLNNGMEFVTHPATFRFHMEKFPWKEFLQKAVELGYRSHDGGTCGLHIHVSRSAFGRDREEQYAGIMKLLYLFEKHWDNIVKFSRRTTSQVERWANRYGLVSDPKELLEYARYTDNRYKAINLTNSNTIEIRIFRGTLRYQTFVATLQFTKVLVDLVNSRDLEQVINMEWKDICDYIFENNYEELMEYLRERELLPEVQLELDVDEYIA